MSGDTLGFEGQSVIVTGAGNGLGRVYALELARRGAAIVVNDLGVSNDGSGAGGRVAEKVVAEIEALGGRAVPSFDSVATPEGGRAIVELAIKSFGQVDAVVANAGILRDKSYYKMELAEFEAVLDVHLRGAYFTTQPAFRAMKDRGQGGRIVFTASPVALFGTFGQPNYVAAKLGVVGLTTSVAIEGARAQIFANCIAPMAATRLTPGMATETSEEHPFAPRRVAPLVAYLCHRDCPSNGHVYMAGHNFHARAAMMLGSGWVARDEDELTAEAVAAHWAQIDDMDGAKALGTAAEIGAMLKASVPFLG
ncbi:SDR family NAD(P)-dependent oxidoreductase [Rhizorhabdus wittichii]|uniref:SDR family NAD(P)-dependent oxidoreductase n=1 Tax=Rhizorhabdus wittichii TaxID=160791 RepID=UPI0003635ECB|nr:SDR family NAD(P)-dependent oxidoreductase [Rhizorhabdus wittichii]